MFRIGTGVVVLLLGLWLVYEGLSEAWLVLVYGVVVGGVGIAILLNRSEDEIEDIRSKDDNEAE